ncbi:nuclear transport factor 2 family protein [Saccharopolyspora oryzae]|uniref:Nuclear transport factor 2 family protein n=1 Tax=Saccharopolyspora oryzae TaxID=2997343 RepID=A0ABT4V5W0_9PSEU|nr:nuclear transport factor 2 family protein [Saccharopolyspora oryzae]MDA3629351.1 nuclear transport factor 2 family protein [Saccharopolyspora oryzae]
MCSCQDRNAVTDVVNRYAYALDTRQWSSLDEVFAADAVARYGSPEASPLHGREEIVASIRSHLDGCGPSQHLLGNHLVEISGDTATAICKARVFHYGAGTRSELPPYECFGVYRDHLRREPAGWRITDRTFDVHLAIGDIEVLQPA